MTARLDPMAFLLFLVVFAMGFFLGHGLGNLPVLNFTF